MQATSVHICTHTRLLPHAHYKTIHYQRCVGGKEKKVTINAVDSRAGFNFDLNEENEQECLAGKEREFQRTGPMYWKYLYPRVFPPNLGTTKIRVSEAEQESG